MPSLLKQVAAALSRFGLIQGAFLPVPGINIRLANSAAAVHVAGESSNR